MAHNYLQYIKTICFLLCFTWVQNASSEGYSWAGVDSLNTALTQIQTINDEKLGALFNKTVDICVNRYRGLKIDLNSAKYSSQDTIKIAQYIKRAEPAIEIYDVSDKFWFYPNTSLFLSLSKPGTMAHRFFVLADSCYGAQEGLTLYYLIYLTRFAREQGPTTDFIEDEKTAQHFLTAWQNLAPQLTGVFREIADLTIKGLAKIIEEIQWENRIWQEVDAINSAASQRSITGQYLNEIFKNALSRSDSMYVFFQIRTKFYASDEYEKRLEACAERAKPIIDVSWDSESIYSEINAKYFLSQSAPNTEDRRFFELAVSGFYSKSDWGCELEFTPIWREKTGHYTYLDNKDKKRQFLKKWQQLAPQLTGFYRQIALATIECLDKELKEESE